MLHPIQYSLIFALLVIARLAKFEWNATGVEWSLFEYERPKIIVIHPISGVTSKRADGMEDTKAAHDEIRLVFLEAFADRIIACSSAEWTWHLLLEKGGD